MPITTTYATATTGLYVRIVNTANGQIWYTATNVFEVYNASHVASYAISLTEGSAPSHYSATIPAALPAGVYTVQFFDPAVSSNPLSSNLLYWSGTAEINDSAPADSAGVTTLTTRLTNTRAGNLDYLDAAISTRSTTVDMATMLSRLTAPRAALLDNLNASISSVISHGDTYWLSAAITAYTPVYAQLGTGEVLWGEIKVYQFEAFGPFVFFVYDSTKPTPQPVDLTGDDIAFVCFDQDGTYRWQIDGCDVMGTYNNLVSVDQDHTNTGEAGNFRYVLRNLTTDKVLAAGRLIIETAADVE